MAVKDIFNQATHIVRKKVESLDAYEKSKGKPEYFKRSIKDYYTRPNLIEKDYQNCLKSKDTNVRELETQYKKVKSIMQWYEFAQTTEGADITKLRKKAQKNFKNAISVGLRHDFNKDGISSFDQSMRIFVEALRVFFPVVKVKNYTKSYNFMRMHNPMTPLVWDALRSDFAEYHIGEEDEINYRYWKITYIIWSMLDSEELADLLYDGVWSFRDMKHTIEQTNTKLKMMFKEHEYIYRLCKNISTGNDGVQNLTVATARSKSR